MKNAPEADATEELDVPKVVAGAWYEVERPVRWYDGSRTSLAGCQIVNPNQALVHFEAFFYPAWPTDFEGLSDLAEDETDKLDWSAKECNFQKRNELFTENYAGPFPSSIGAKRTRSFPCVAHHPMTMQLLPLMAFLAETTVNRDYSRPGKLLHWMHCLTYTLSPKQERSGMIWKEMWKDPQYSLFSRKGSPQDHAVLLCSMLLGMGRDAYVVKGTIQVGKDLVEHVWVMTREDGSWVTFWEPSTRELYHLPNRWKEEKRKKQAAGSAIVEKKDEDEEEEDELAMQDYSTHEVSDVMVELDTDLPTVGRGPRPKAKSKSGPVGRDAVKLQMLETQKTLPTAPKTELLGDQSLVDWLPYDSIDVVFNKSQLWANRQNVHPACISYNLEDSFPMDVEEEASWMTLMSDKERNKYPIDYVAHNVLMEASLKPSQIRYLEDQLVNEQQDIQEDSLSNSRSI